MRFNIIHTRTDTVIGETDQFEVAVAVLVGDEHEQFSVVDTWSGTNVDRPEKDDDSIIKLLPVDYIKSTLTKYHMQGGQSPKIPLIKMVRELTGWGLGEAKTYIDRLDTEENMRARQVDPTENTW